MDENTQLQYFFKVIVLFIISTIVSIVARKLISRYYVKAPEIFKPDDSTQKIYKNLSTFVIYMLGAAYAIYNIPPFYNWIKQATGGLGFVKYLVIIIITIFTSIFVAGILRKMLIKYVQDSSESLKIDHTKYSFLKHAVSFIVFIIATIVIVYTIPALRSLGLTLFASAGIFTAVLALASQQAFANIISGVFIVIFKPFRVDDLISIKEHLGYVEDITLRHTVIRNFENRRVVIPNSIISKETILNSSIVDDKVCNFIMMKISFTSDIELAMKTMEEVAMQHKNFIDNRTEEEKAGGDRAVVVRVLSVNESSITLRASVWSENSTKGFIMKCNLLQQYKEKFEELGIEVPYPYFNIVDKSNRKEV